MVLAGCTDDAGEDAVPTTTAVPADADEATTTSVAADEAPDATDDADPTLPPAPDPDPTPLPIADDIRTGVLDNGLTYYVRSNDSPGSAVALRLVVRAGGRQEDPLGTGSRTGATTSTSPSTFWPNGRRGPRSPRARWRRRSRSSARSAASATKVAMASSVTPSSRRTSSKLHSKA